MKRLLAFASIAALCTGTALAEPPAGQPKPTAPTTTQPAAKKPTAFKPTETKPADKTAVPAHGMPDAAQMMAAMEAAAKPGPMHKWMQHFEGTWTSTVKEMDMTTGKWNESQGSAKGAMNLGGRFLEMSFEGTCHGKPMLGYGTMGYNNTDERFECTWYSSQCSSLCYMTGTVDSSQRVLTLSCEGTCPVTKEKMKMREVVTITGKDSYMQEFYMTMDGKESKMMEIVNIRKVGAAKPDAKTVKAQ